VRQGEVQCHYHSSLSLASLHLERTCPCNVKPRLPQRKLPAAIIASQVHAYEAKSRSDRGTVCRTGPSSHTDEMVAAMRQAAVDGAILHLRLLMALPHYDDRLAPGGANVTHPERLHVKPVDPDDPAVEDVVADWKKTPGAVWNPPHADKGGQARDLMTRRPRPDARRPFATTSRATSCVGQLEVGTALKRSPSRHAFIIDPLCHHAPRVPPAAAALRPTFSKSAGTRQAPERGSRSAVPARCLNVYFPGHLGSA